MTDLHTEALERAGMRARRTASAEAALREITTVAWDALVVDLDVPGAIRVLRAALSSPAGDPTILTTSLSGRGTAVAEAHALELPFVPRALLTNALHAWMVAALNARRISEPRPPDEDSLHRGPELSPREAAVFSLLTRGRAPKEIAHTLGITHETVRTHARKAYRKMGVSNLREAMAAMLDG